MVSCDLLVVGGGPAGSTCAWKLRQAGLDVLLMDKEIFPRVKPCAGWITPAVLAALAIDQDEYRHGRVFQEISSFRTGLMGGPEIVTRYDEPVSYGIRRCEFDHYLLQRSGVRQSLGEPVSVLERQNGWWLVNGRIKARLLIGAGGHFCPVARLLGAKIGSEDVVVARVAEYPLSPHQERLCSTTADMPALYFCRDLKGYGWLFRKGRFVNVGLGRMDQKDFNLHMRDFCKFLENKGDLAAGYSGLLRGHAYLLAGSPGGRRCVGDGALLIGDAAGVARLQSGEGILSAIESALLAADVILASRGDYSRANLEPYAAGLATRFGKGDKGGPSLQLFSGPSHSIVGRLFSSRLFTRHIVLNRWFLHANQHKLHAATVEM